MIDKGEFDKTYKVETVLLLRFIESLSIKKDLAGAAPYTFLNVKFKNVSNRPFKNAFGIGPI